MERKRDNSHYHIRWTGSALDWERFDTFQEAEASAKQLARSGETYVIEPYNEETCAQCLKMMLTPGPRGFEYGRWRVSLR